MADIYMVVGDTLPQTQVQLYDNAGPVNLTGFTVTLEMTSSTSSISRACTVVSAESGIVLVPWDTADTDTAGTFSGRFVLSGASGVMSIPNGRSITLVVREP